MEISLEMCTKIVHSHFYEYLLNPNLEFFLKKNNDIFIFSTKNVVRRFIKGWINR
jgi:hypothetical protein